MSCPGEPQDPRLCASGIFTAAMSETTGTLVKVKLLWGYPPSPLCFSTSV